MKVLQICILLSALCALCWAQDLTDCSQLALGTTGPPFTSAGHEICEDNGNQCCTPDILNEFRGRAVTKLRDSLRDALAEFETEYAALAQALDSYLTGSFSNNLAQSFPFAARFDSATLNSFQLSLSNILGSFTITDVASDSFNPEGFIDSIIAVVAEIQAQGFQGQQRQCITEAIDANVDQAVGREIGNQIQTVRQSLTALDRIRDFLRDDYPSLVADNFTPIESCVERMVRWNYCGRCDLTPPLCRGSCNSLVRGCLSSVYTAFERDFRQFNTISMRIINNLEQTTRSLYDNLQQNLITNFRELALAIQNCLGLQPPSLPTGFPTTQLPTGFPTTQLPTGFPTTQFPTGFPPATVPATPAGLDDESTFRGLRDMLNNMDDYFGYGVNGPTGCRPEPSESDFCLNQNIERNQDTCRLDGQCTSECNCWDGTQMRSTDFPSFTGGNRIVDQFANPAVDEYIGDLEDQASMLGIDTPANAFLQSDTFTEVAPEGVSIPDADPYTAGAVRVVVSVVVLAMAAMVGLLL